MPSIGKTTWVIPEGFIPSASTGPAPDMTSHETACILNASGKDANVTITIYFTNKPPVGPYHIIVPAERSKHVRYNDLKDPVPIPLDTEYASIIVSDIPIVVQFSRLDTRQAAMALMTSLAFPVPD